MFHPDGSEDMSRSAPNPDRAPDRSSPLPPPTWASHSITEDGGITHETVSPLHPTVTWSAPHGWTLVPTEVTLSVTDLHLNGQWTRTTPTIQIEGGSYSPQGARQLRSAVNAFLAALAADSGDPVSPPA